MGEVSYTYCWGGGVRVVKCSVKVKRLERLEILASDKGRRITTFWINAEFFNSFQP
jgi:hypothetical protein